MAQNDSGIPVCITNSSSSAVTMRQAPARACVDVSGVAFTTSGTLAAANANRIGIFIQNIGVNNINENVFKTGMPNSDNEIAAWYHNWHDWLKERQGAEEYH